MNEQGKKALIKVAEWLEAGAPHVKVADGFELGRFDMEFAVLPEPGCGTACCIAGAVCQFEKLGHRGSYGSLVFFGELGAGALTQEFLGIDQTDANYLFTPWEYYYNRHSSEFSKPARAAAVIRNFLETGEVDWNLFDEFGNKY